MRRVRNAMESIVEYIYESEITRLHKMKCNCDQCVSDVFALALNHLPPRYVSTSVGEAFVETMVMDIQLKLDVVRELMMAVVTVENNPRHD